MRDAMPAWGTDIEDLLRARSHEAARRVLRTEMLSIEDDHLVLRAALHLMEPTVEAALAARMRQLDDEIVLLGHCPPEPSVERSLAVATALRSSLALALRTGVRTVDVRIADHVRPGPAREWTRDDLPEEVLRAADQRLAALRVVLGDAVATLIDSEVVRIRRTRRTSPTGAVELELTEHDPDTVARAEAFVADAALLARTASDLSEQLRAAAMRRRVAREHGLVDRNWAIGAALRKRRACSALDRSRARHAALTELAELDAVVNG